MSAHLTCSETSFTLLALVLVDGLQSAVEPALPSKLTLAELILFAIRACRMLFDICLDTSIYPSRDVMAPPPATLYSMLVGLYTLNMADVVRLLYASA